ncbi:MAG: hypothetical protein WBO17_16505 [Sphingorhabdus sp.]
MELGLSYTTGYADPTQVKRLTRKVQAAVGNQHMTTLHVNNTPELDLANVLAGLEEGITTFDAALWAALAIDPSREERAEISLPRISCSCCRRWDSRRESISKICSESEKFSQQLCPMKTYRVLSQALMFRSISREGIRHERHPSFRYLCDKIHPHDFGAIGQRNLRFIGGRGDSWGSDWRPPS